MVRFSINGRQYSATVSEFFNILKKGIAGKIQILDYPEGG